MTIITNHTDRKITVYPQDDPRQPEAYINGYRCIHAWIIGETSCPHCTDDEIKLHKIARDNINWGPRTIKLVVSDENGNRSYEAVDNYWLYGDR